MQRHFSVTSKWLVVICAIVLLGLTAGEGPTYACVVENGRGVFLCFETELTELSLSGGPFPMPLASDPLNLLGDSIEGYGFVNSSVSLSLSSQRLVAPGMPSLGQAHAFQGELFQVVGSRAC